MAWISGIGECRLRIISTERDFIFLCWEEVGQHGRCGLKVVRSTSSWRHSMTLSKSIAHNVIKERTTADLMVALSGLYEKPSVNNKVLLMIKLFNLKMAKGTPVAQHLNKFNNITNQL